MGKRVRCDGHPRTYEHVLLLLETTLEATVDGFLRQSEM